MTISAVFPPVAIYYPEYRLIPMTGEDWICLSIWILVMLLWSGLPRRVDGFKSRFDG